MEKLLYYPNFEIKDDSFLKFSLIYLDEIKPIIPYCAMNQLSKETNSIINNTDLINPIQPSKRAGELASFSAIEYFESMNKCHKYSYGNNISGISPRECIRNYVLYSDKYSWEFENYCIENNMAERCNEGMKINNYVAFTFMSILADLISKENEIGMITDDRNFSDYNLKTMSREHVNINNRIKEIKREIEFQIPVDIKKISVLEFIRLRADDHFNELRKSFVIELNKVLLKQHNDLVGIDLHDYLSCKEELQALLKEVFISCAAVTVCAKSFGDALVNPDNSLAFFANVGSGIIGLEELKHKIVSMKDYIDSLETKRQASRFLAKMYTIGLGKL